MIANRSLYRWRRARPGCGAPIVRSEESRIATNFARERAEKNQRAWKRLPREVLLPPLTPAIFLLTSNLNDSIHSTNCSRTSLQNQKGRIDPWQLRRVRKRPRRKRRSNTSSNEYTNGDAKSVPDVFALDTAAEHLSSFVRKRDRLRRLSGKALHAALHGRERTRTFVILASGVLQVAPHGHVVIRELL